MLRHFCCLASAAAAGGAVCARCGRHVLGRYGMARFQGSSGWSGAPWARHSDEQLGSVPGAPPEARDVGCWFVGRIRIAAASGTGAESGAGARAGSVQCAEAGAVGSAASMCGMLGWSGPLAARRVRKRGGATREPAPGPLFTLGPSSVDGWGRRSALMSRTAAPPRASSRQGSSSCRHRTLTAPRSTVCSAGARLSPKHRIWAARPAARLPSSRFGASLQQPHRERPRLGGAPSRRCGRPAV